MFKNISKCGEKQNLKYIMMVSTCKVKSEVTPLRDDHDYGKVAKRQAASWYESRIRRISSFKRYGINRRITQYYTPFYYISSINIAWAENYKVLTLHGYLFALLIFLLIEINLSINNSSPEVKLITFIFNYSPILKKTNLKFNLAGYRIWQLI